MALNIANFNIFEHPILLVLGGLAIVILLLVSYLTFKVQPSCKNAPPLVSVGIPILGPILAFTSGPVDMIAKCYEKYGPMFTLPMFGKRLTFIIGPEMSSPFFKGTDDEMSQNEVYGFMKPVFGEGVVYDAPEIYRRQQMQHMSKALKSDRLKIYVGKIQKETEAYLRQWKDSGELNLVEALSELTILTATRCLHGDDVREDMYAEVSRLYHDLDKGITPISFFFPNAPLAAHKKRDQARIEMVKLFSTTIKKRRENLERYKDNTDILQVFMELKYSDGTELSDDQITGLLIALLFAGQHTSSVTSTWTALLLAHNKPCMDKFLEEQDRVVGNDLQLNFDMVQDMNYAHCAVREALRLHPPLIMLMRYARKDMEFKSSDSKMTFTVPKGDLCFTCPKVSMRLAHVFTNPDVYDPDRLWEPRKEDSVPMSYLGFGAGTHTCMGQQFGLMQVKTILSILLRNFEIELVAPDLPRDDYSGMVVGPIEHECFIRYKRRATAYV